MEVREIEGYKAVRSANANIAVITYTLSNDIISEIGIVREKNPHFSAGFCENLISGIVTDDDASLLERAMTELKTVTGLAVKDSLKWCYLGEIYHSKISPDPIYIFSVNVTGCKLQKLTSDTVLSFTLVPVNDALKIQDSILQTSFFKLFMKLYQKEIKDTTCTTYQTENNAEILPEN